MDSWVVLLIFAIVLTGSGFIQSLIGFGYAVVAMSILPHIMDVRLANLALSMSVILPTILAARAYRHDLDLSALAWSFTGACLLLPVGLLAFKYLSTDLLVRSTGLAILLIALPAIGRSRSMSPRLTSRWLSAAAGAISGFLTGAVGIGGPPIAAYAVSQRWSHRQIKAFVLGFLVLLSLVKAIGVLLVGWVDATVLLYSVIAIPFALLGARLGVVASRYIEADRLRGIIIMVLVAVAAELAVCGNGATTTGDQAWQPGGEPGFHSKQIARQVSR